MPPTPVHDNGPGLSVEKTVSGLTTIEIVLTQLHACRQAKKKVNETLCGIGLVATNILSESLLIETVQDGWEDRQEFAQGHATGSIEQIKATTEQWQQIKFTPGPEIFGDNPLKYTYSLATDIAPPEYTTDQMKHALADLRLAYVSLKSQRENDTDYYNAVRNALASGDGRAKRLAESNPTPAVTYSIVASYVRNPDVVTDVLDRANGICEC